MKEVNIMMLSAVYAVILQYLILVRAYFTKNLAYKILGVLIVAGTFYYITETSTGITWDDHSQTNMIVANATMLSILLATFTIISSYKLFRYSRKAWCCLKVFLLLVLVYFYFVRVHSSCSHL